MCLAACSRGKSSGHDDAAQNTPATGGQLGTNGGAPGSGGRMGSGGGSGTGGKVGTGGMQGGAGGANVAGNPDTSIAVDTANDSSGSPRLDTSATSDDAKGACPAGYKLTWSDEFEGPAGTAADATKWVYESGNGSNGWGNSELEYYRTGNANAAMDGNGNLVITAKQETASGFQYTSARLKTQGLATWTYGHIEARIKLPSGQGIWPAFWMLGSDITTQSWPACGEIDIMENIGKEPAINHGSLHMPASGTSNDSQLTGSYTLANAKLSDDFHIYAIDWSASGIDFFFDGSRYESQTPASATGRTWAFDKPFFILLNVAVGGQWPGSPDSTTTFPQTMTVDYVRVCQK